MNDSWTRLAILLAFAATLLGQVVIVHEETRKPNTILFLVDDTGFGSLRFHSWFKSLGCKCAETLCPPLRPRGSDRRG